MVNLLNPRAGEVVYDPTCGTGGMLPESQVGAEQVDEDQCRISIDAINAPAQGCALVDVNMR